MTYPPPVYRRLRRGPLGRRGRTCFGKGLRASASPTIRCGQRPPDRRRASGADRTQPGLPAEPRNRPVVAHLPAERGPALLGRAARRLGEAHRRIARPFHRPFSVGLRADVGFRGRRGAARQREPGGRGAGEVPEGQQRGKRQWLPERISTVVFRSAEGRPEGLGAVVHVAQNHGGPARHVRVSGERAGARRRARHGWVDETVDRFYKRRSHGAHTEGGIRRHERSALQPVRGSPA